MSLVITRIVKDIVADDPFAKGAAMAGRLLTRGRTRRQKIC